LIYCVFWIQTWHQTGSNNLIRMVHRQFIVCFLNDNICILQQLFLFSFCLWFSSNRKSMQTANGNLFSDVVSFVCECCAVFCRLCTLCHGHVTTVHTQFVMCP
jgi:hypothetical protein